MWFFFDTELNLYFNKFECKSEKQIITNDLITAGNVSIKNNLCLLKKGNIIVKDRKCIALTYVHDHLILIINPKQNFD